MDGGEEDFLAEEVRLELGQLCSVARLLLGWDWLKVRGWLERVEAATGWVAWRPGLMSDWARVALANRLAKELEAAGIGGRVAESLRGLAAGER